MRSVHIVINGKSLNVDESKTILQAATDANIKIPTLCHHPDLDHLANCRVCLVDVSGYKNLQTACSTKVQEGMVIETSNKRVREARRIILEMMLSNHETNCTTCSSNGICDLQKLTTTLGVDSIRFDNVLDEVPIARGNPSIVRDMNKCIKCGRCVQMCNEIQKVGAIYNIGRSTDMHMGPAYDYDLLEAKCTLCGQCINVCPVGAIYEKSDVSEVLEAIEDKDKFLVVQIAPAVRVSIGEMFGEPPGTIVTGKIPAILRRLGFDKVFDTNFTADLTIIEEGTEFLNRLNNGGPLPLLTSCSPGWINYIEQFYPELLAYVSTCKSPQQMFGTLAKTYYAEKIGKRAEDIFVVSIMPCTAKKFEATREEMQTNGIRDVDFVLTTREFAAMIKMQGYDFNNMPTEAFDEPFGITTGAAAIFAASGGVMEAALRTVYELVTEKELENIDLKMVRGIEGLKEATIKVGDLDVNVAVTNSLGNAKLILDMIKDGRSNYHFVEIMCCPGGCIGGGGQPRPTTNAIRLQRMQGIYQCDEQMTIRKSHKNPFVLKLYEDFLGEANGELAHKLLHTQYKNRKR